MALHRLGPITVLSEQGSANAVLFGRDAHNCSPVGIVLYDPVRHLPV